MTKPHCPCERLGHVGSVGRNEAWVQLQSDKIALANVFFANFDPNSKEVFKYKEYSLVRLGINATFGTKPQRVAHAKTKT